MVWQIRASLLPVTINNSLEAQTPILPNCGGRRAAKTHGESRLNLSEILDAHVEHRLAHPHREFIDAAQQVMDDKPFAPGVDVIDTLGLI